MNDTTFQVDGKVAYVPVVVNAKPKPITNSMKIRAMSDEELAKWINNMQADAYNRGTLEDWIVGYPDCYDKWLNWMRQEVQE